MKSVFLKDGHGLINISFPFKRIMDCISMDMRPITASDVKAFFQSYGIEILNVEYSTVDGQLWFIIHEKDEIKMRMIV